MGIGSLILQLGWIHEERNGFVLNEKIKHALILNLALLAE